MTDRPTSEVLDLAADHIEARDWAQGRGWNRGDDAPLCLEGGIMAAVGLKAEFCELDAVRYDLLACPAYAAVTEYLGFHPNHSVLWGWNDHHARTKEEVIEVLRATAAVQRLKEHNALTITPVSLVAVDA